MKKRYPILLGLFLIVMSSVGSASASEYSFEFDDTAWGLGIESFIWHFDYEEGASGVKSLIYGNALLDPSWIKYPPNDSDVTGKLKLQAVDLSFTKPMGAGTILNLNVNGTLNWSSDPVFPTFEFRDLGNDLIPVFFQGDLLDGETITFSADAVPIPPAIFLLGGGICALWGIGRRNRRDSPFLH